jgi:hypothetical protein
MAIKNTFESPIESNEIQNVADNILQKLKILDIKLPRLAELADVDYFTLRKIINCEPGYLPNLRILIKLADFFNISTGDLMNFSNLPQYIPDIELSNVELFLNNKLSEFELQSRIFCDSYVHKEAFSIKRTMLNFNIETVINNICYPTSKFYKEGIFIAKILNNLNFIQVNNIKNNLVYFKYENSQNDESIEIDKIQPIAVVVRFIMDQGII